MEHVFPVGAEVNARMCMLPLGRGVVVTHEEYPLYRVRTPDGDYPVYETEITAVETTNAQV